MRPQMKAVHYKKLITDKGESLQILNREGLDGLTPDSIYRSVSIYELKRIGR